MCEAAVSPGRSLAATLAGTGSTGSTNGVGTAASFYQPYGVTAVDDLLYVGDKGNHLIRKIDIASATVSTFAGSGSTACVTCPAGTTGTVPGSSGTGGASGCTVISGYSGTVTATTEDPFYTTDVAGSSTAAIYPASVALSTLHALVPLF